MSYIKSNDYDGAKIGVWIVKNSTDTILYSAGGPGTNASGPTSDTTKIAPFSSIETLKDPFGDGISINSSNSRKLMLPTGKYWLDWRAGIFSGNSVDNFYYYFDLNLAGYVPSSNSSKWIARNGASYLEESVNSLHARNVYGYYESVSSSCYIQCIHSIWWQTGGTGGTPSINKADAGNLFGNNTDFPYGESRLLVMRLE